MKRFENTWQYLVYLRGAGNPDNQQYCDVCRPALVLCESLEDASKECKKYIQQNELGGGNWGGSFPNDVYQSGHVFDLDGKLVKYISYNGRIWEPEIQAALPAEFCLDVQFCSWNKWQVNQLEANLRTVGASYIMTEDWTGGMEDPAVITFVEISGRTVNQLLAIAQQSSPYIHLTYVGLN